MTDQPMALFDQLVDAVLDTPGETNGALRRALVEETALLCNTGKGEGVDAKLDAYVKKVALHAYRVTDEDIARLRASGYGEDAIFEITLSIALGAGMNCLTQAMQAVRGTKYALEEH